MSQPLRILCLPGWRTNANILRAQVSGFLVDPAFAIQFDPIDATFPAGGPPHASITNFFPKETSLYEWWNRDDATGEYVGLSESLDRVADILEKANPPYDGIMGFSQGAALTATVARLSTATGPQKDDRFFGKLKFVVCCAGFAPRDPKLKALFKDSAVDLPSLHVWGSEDSMATASSLLSQQFNQEKAVVVLHTGGHTVPRHSRKSESYARVHSFFEQFVARG
eukprot:TRINITY_DN13549_c0_g1_i1.p1 TRINITY_DN13549_c0_g1~~TRINITY_DN13549_c0_g1_i1.p1  ORF type:complete len:224 (+),score=70.17 TRINITY_DN13549_c0_g1_i1:504-1175(+)